MSGHRLREATPARERASVQSSSLGTPVEFWTTEQRGAVAIATFSNPLRNYLVAPAVDELEQLIAEWRDPSIRAVVIQSRPEDAGFMTHYSVEELYALISDPMTTRYSGAIVRRYKAIFDRMQALPKVIIAAMNGTPWAVGLS